MELVDEVLTAFFLERNPITKTASSKLMRYGEAFRIESFVPCVFCHHPIRSACNVSMVFVYGTCIQYIPYGAQFSWWSLPINYFNNNMEKNRTLKSFEMKTIQLDKFTTINGITYLLSENGFWLTAKTLLFTIVTTTSLCWRTFLWFFILCHFVQFVTLAFLAKSTPLFWYVHLKISHKKMHTWEIKAIVVFGGSIFIFNTISHHIGKHSLFIVQHHTHFIQRHFFHVFHAYFAKRL